MLTIGEVIKTFLQCNSAKAEKVPGNWEQNDSEAEDYIKNRPFYKRTIFDIQWDGNTKGLDCVDDRFYLVSDTVPDKDDILGSTCIINIGAVKETITVTDDFLRVGDGFVSVLDGIILAYAENAVASGITFPKVGSWFPKREGMFVQSLQKIERKTIDVEYLPEIPAEKLPEIPAEKLPEIPAEKLPEIPAEKLPEIPVIELTANIIDSIASDKQPSYTVKNLSYSDLLEIFNRGIFAFKDSYSMYYPLKTSVNTSGDLNAVIFTSEVLKQSLVYAILVCSNGNTRFYRNSYRTISETT